MRLILLVIVVAVNFQSFNRVFANSSFDADLLFKGDANQTLYMWHRIPFFESGDLKAFSEAYGPSRRSLRRGLIDEAITLMDSGAYGMEALAVVMQFDDLVSDHRQAAKRQLGLAMGRFFSTELNERYRKFRPTIRRLEFLDLSAVEDRSQVILGNSQIDLVLYGTYSASDRVPGGVKLVLSIVNIHTHVQRHFYAEGKPDRAAFSLAQQLFHEFHLTRYPSVFNLGTFGTLALLEKVLMVGTYSTSIRASYQEAQLHCQSLNGRLPDYQEFTLLKRAGGYQGGVFVSRAEQDYFWALKGNNIYISYEKRVESAFMMSSGKFFNYICVRSNG